MAAAASTERLYSLPSFSWRSKVVCVRKRRFWTVKTLDQACIPRKSVFEFAGKDTVYDLTDLDAINADEFFG